MTAARRASPNALFRLFCLRRLSILGCLYSGGCRRRNPVRVGATPVDAWSPGAPPAGPLVVPGEPVSRQASCHHGGTRSSGAERRQGRILRFCPFSAILWS